MIAPMINSYNWNLRISFFIFFCILLLYISTCFLNSSIKISSNKLPKRFDDFDFERGNDVFIVPNWIHIIRFGKKEIDFVEAVCILAALKNQQPDLLFIHTDIFPIGLYWKVVKKIIGKKLRLVQVEAPKKVFGNDLSKPWRYSHGSDVLRLRILRTYGGIYMDGDTYIVRNIDHFRRYEIALGWKRGKPLQNQLIVAHKDARLLKLWLKGYEDDYQSKKWYHNAGDLPTKILESNASLAHAVPVLFGNYGVIQKIFQKNWPEWRNYYAIHLMVRHQYLLKNITNVAQYPVKFNHHNIHRYNITFRQMVYDVYPYN